MKKELPQLNRRHVITASEIGEFVYCAKAWYFRRCGEAAQGRQLEEGTTFHRRHAAGVSQAARLRRAGRALALLALILFIVLTLVWLATGIFR
ncbi:MAG TPA: hypothetical protein VFD58_26295 [Blastocatellia bacterium]|nr:hypothetical protein [Blastocatellia bacterium]